MFVLLSATGVGFITSLVFVCVVVSLAGVCFTVSAAGDVFVASGGFVSLCLSQMFVLLN
jgi:hypothetical protein